jgi:hypothetical protein
MIKIDLIWDIAKNGFENYIWSFTSQSQGEGWVHYNNAHHWIFEIN